MHPRSIQQVLIRPHKLWIYRSFSRIPLTTLGKYTIGDNFGMSMTMSSASTRSQRHSTYGDEQLWKVCDRLADKEGFRHNIYWVTGEQYRGYWSHNKKEGVGIHIYRNGNRYEGQWKNGMRDGQGTFWIIDGKKYRVLYRGFWKEDKWHGKGTLYGANGETYEGEFKAGKRSGSGKQTYWSEITGTFEVYIGHWINDKREGIGTLYKVNGDRYEGSFANNMKDGKGVLYFSDKCSKYEGLWQADLAICGTYIRMEDSQHGLPPLEVQDPDSLLEAIMESTAKIGEQSYNTLTNKGGIPIQEQMTD